MFTVSNIDHNKTGIVKKSKVTETNNSVNTVKNMQFIHNNVLADENSWSNVNTFLFSPCNAMQKSNQDVVCCLICHQLLTPLMCLEYHSN